MDLDQYLEKMITNTKIIWIQKCGDDFVKLLIIVLNVQYFLTKTYFQAPSNPIFHQLSRFITIFTQFLVNMLFHTSQISSSLTFLLASLVGMSDYEEMCLVCWDYEGYAFFAQLVTRGCLSATQASLVQGASPPVQTETCCSVHDCPKHSRGYAPLCLIQSCMLANMLLQETSFLSLLP